MSKIESFLQILSSYNINPGATTILDIGFGNGKFTLELGKIFKKVVAIDKSAESVKTFQKRASDYSNISGENEHLYNHFCLEYFPAHNIDASELSKFGDNVFDVILCRNSLHFIKNIPKFYDDVRFVMRSHGIFIKISSPLFDLSKDFPLIDTRLKLFLQFIQRITTFQ